LDAFVALSRRADYLTGLRAGFSGLVFPERFMARDITDASSIESRDALVAWFEEGCKPADQFRVGTEHEKIPFFRGSHAPVAFEGAKGIQALLQGMQAKLGWESILDEGRLIGLYDANGGGAISLEPGGQFELSGAPLTTIHETAAEIERHLADVANVGRALGIGFLTLGLSPKWTLAETPVMPKSRYQIMARYMPRVGSRGLDMMFRTATVQANLDFSSEADMVKKLRVGLALQPIATALFANSPFLEGRPNGLLSGRSEIWRDTDNARAGMLPFAFESGMGFERYVDYALDVPMYFVKRGAHYHDVAGASFRDLLAGRLAALPGERATMSDWVNHLSTIFPEVRLKRYLEMRGADVGPRERICALPALFVGLYYDSIALDAALELINAWSAEERQKLRDNVPRLALAARIGGRSVRDVARDVLAISRAGLARRGRRDASGRDETIYLEPLERIVETGQTAAEDWLAGYAGPWRKTVEPIFEEAAY
jgi:glutamate--cysteine ligase